MKRSKKIMMTTMLTGAAFALSACQTEPPEKAYNFSSPDACYNQIPEGTWMDEWKPVCDEAFENAKTAHEVEAPRYALSGSDGDDLCEEVHGDDQCYQMTDSSGNSWFVPFMAGYLISSAFDSSSNKYKYGYASSKPLYKTSSGGFTNSSFAYSTSRLNTSSRVSSNPTRYTTSTPKTYTSAPAIRSTGGFGASSTSSRSGSFGG